MVEGHVPQGVEVQVLSSALEDVKNPRCGDFLFQAAWALASVVRLVLPK
jgi:hypothetical protein